MDFISSPLKLAAMSLALPITLSCTKGDPKIEGSLSGLSSPTYQGKSSWDIPITTTNAAISFTGDCDKRISKLEGSVDGTTWTSNIFSDSDCADGKYTISVSDISQYMTFTPGI